jgi:superfamily II DNA or RNA helicase|tara:strand:- start:194 stop:1867 length:1674 start_codon:yes stop_codon:yes gene_type:complete
MQNRLENPWSYLSSDVLQKYITKEVIDELSYFLPNLRPNEFKENEITKKRNLAKIFNSFSGADSLEKREFRDLFFSSLPTEKLEKLSSVFGENLFRGNREEIIQKLKSLRWIKEEKQIKICEMLNIDQSLLPEEKYVVPAELSSFEMLKPFKQLKDYQFPVVAKAKEKLKNTAARFFIQMPTGSGKTRVAMEVISEFIKNSNREVKILWLAHQKELCVQSYDCFVEVWSHLKDRELVLYRLWNEGDKVSLSKNLSKNSLIISNFQKIYSELSNDENHYNQIKKKLDLIIIDEAHKAIAPTYKFVTDTLASVKTKIIGLTATPGRSITDEESNRSLAIFFHSERVEIAPPNNERVISYLKQRKVLSKADHEPIHVDLKIELSKKQVEYIKENLELPKSIISSLSNNEVRNFEILKKIDNRLKNKPKSKIIFFGLSIKHSKFICAVLNIMGVKASHVDGGTSMNRRNSILEDFKNGDLQVLCNERLISTGFDAPKTDTIVIARPTFSIVLYSQIIGRGLRGPTIGGTEHCKIIDVKDNIRGYSDFDSLYEYFDEYFENR